MWLSGDEYVTHPMLSCRPKSGRKERLQQEWPDGPTHINQIEEMAERIGREVMHEITSEMLSEQTEPKPDNQSACACGAMARYRSLNWLMLVTTHGRIRVRRPYFH